MKAIYRCSPNGLSAHVLLAHERALASQFCHASCAHGCEYSHIMRGSDIYDKIWIHREDN